jgi:cytochrome c oxidase subunit 3
MPTTISPPHIDRKPDRHHTTDGDNGSGRRPPVDKRTGGNGDGDNWNEQPQGKRGPRERLSRARIGIFFTLCVIIMFFIGLIGADLVTKANGHFDAHGIYVMEWHAIAIPRILWINTALLLISTITAEAARRRMFREHDLMEEWLGLGRPISGRATAWLSVTLVFGLAFVAGQWQAWREIASRHILIRQNPSSKFFYLLTVSHAVHLVIGIGALAAALIVLQRSRQIATRQVVVDTTVWYWHTMGVLWLFLFLLLEYGQ